MATMPSQFWRDIEAAYNQVAARHDRAIAIIRDSEDLTATVTYDTLSDSVVIAVRVGSNGNTVVSQRLEKEIDYASDRT